MTMLTPTHASSGAWAMKMHEWLVQKAARADPSSGTVPRSLARALGQAVALWNIMLNFVVAGGTYVPHHHSS